MDARLRAVRKSVKQRYRQASDDFSECLAAIGAAHLLFYSLIAALHRPSPAHEAIEREARPLATAIAAVGIP